MSKSKKSTRLRASLVGVVISLLALTGCVAGEGQQTDSAEASKVLRLDYAYWNPLSLVIRDQGWLETELAAQGYQVEWILSAGSWAALENLNAKVIDIGSSAGSAAFAAHANGVAINTIGVFSQPNWASLVVAKDSEITKVSELAGKKIAATSGTDPYFFLLQALDEVGLTASDVEIVNLAHADGQKALENGDVDVWSGLDPLTATSEKNAGTKIIYSNPSFNSWGVINARTEFLESNPELVEIVLVQYQKARAWILANPTKAAEILAREAQLDADVATKVLTERTNVDVSLIPGETQLAVFRIITPVLVAEGKIKSQEAADLALQTLINDSIAKKVG
ncbi:aliphatic sulfonate ABC transporter substrate-binding protein [Candidatus Aquiluna sp. UB-MaderosW2red]|uniref:aliphatic sulfonate ABC transporter substrate-binding protein n=1 Tax=Candidatus Aquiluna sp. UB-MaderosW2red TaxID=1855377 RepID=UPI000875AECC|nr:aliphatic sulfonate ABC transporter substrate-binding protein [Candidatus Aquiluna sp. UB-MaderosW2red]SCX15007.1 sulfonate transport system substrate-binding protein [Candidatus Aquiluna sp. UB-MaderosW2red]